MIIIRSEVGRKGKVSFNSVEGDDVSAYIRAALGQHRCMCLAQLPARAQVDLSGGLTNLLARLRESQHRDPKYKSYELQLLDGLWASYRQSKESSLLHSERESGKGKAGSFRA